MNDAEIYELVRENLEKGNMADVHKISLQMDNFFMIVQNGNPILNLFAKHCKQITLPVMARIGNRHIEGKVVWDMDSEGETPYSITEKIEGSEDGRVTIAFKLIGASILSRLFRNLIDRNGNECVRVDKFSELVKKSGERAKRNIITIIKDNYSNDEEIVEMAESLLGCDTIDDGKLGELLRIVLE